MMNHIKSNNTESDYIYSGYGLKDSKQVIFLSAPSNKGKSSFLAYLLLCTFYKVPFLGAEYKSKKDYKVCWCDSGEQDDSQILDLLLKFRTQFDSSEESFANTVDEHFNIHNLENKHSADAESNKKFSNELESLFQNNDIIIIDSLSSTTCLDLNSSTASNMIYDIIAPLTIKYNKPVIITVHQSSKSGNTETLLGSSLIQATADEIWSLKSELQDDKYQCEMEVRKSRLSLGGRKAYYIFQSSGYKKELEDEMAKALGGISTISTLTWQKTGQGSREYNPKKISMSSQEDQFIRIIMSLPESSRVKTPLYNIYKGQFGIPTDKASGLRKVQHCMEIAAAMG